MSYPNLVMHGLKSMIEFSEEILFFLIKIFMVVLLFTFGTGGVILYKKYISKEAVLGWASSLGVSLLNACLIIFGTIIISLLLLSLNNSIKQNQIDYDEIK